MKNSPFKQYIKYDKVIRKMEILTAIDNVYQKINKSISSNKNANIDVNNELKTLASLIQREISPKMKNKIKKLCDTLNDQTGLESYSKEVYGDQNKLIGRIVPGALKDSIDRIKIAAEIPINKDQDNPLMTDGQWRENLQKESAALKAYLAKDAEKISSSRKKNLEEAIKSLDEMIKNNPKFKQTNDDDYLTPEMKRELEKCKKGGREEEILIKVLMSIQKVL